MKNPHSGVAPSELRPSRQITALLSDEQYGEFQARLAANPQLEALIKGGGGIRKVRVAVGARGKRGGARVIYYWAARRDLILLLYAYPRTWPRI
jgi:hypothetical protein